MSAEPVEPTSAHWARIQRSAELLARFARLVELLFRVESGEADDEADALEEGLQAFLEDLSDL